MNKIEIYTDGSCLGNPGPGGWGVIILDGDNLSGGESETTNNRMEMTAIIKALEWVHKKSGIKSSELNNCNIIIYSDSNLIIQTLNQGWKRKANTDLWAQIDKLRAWLNISWVWVKAHHTNKNNNQVDKLAFDAAQQFKKPGNF
ncbi:MAG: ribonuclease H [Patescibacteria group bacterium]